MFELVSTLSMSMFCMEKPLNDPITFDTLSSFNEMSVIDVLENIKWLFCKQIYQINNVLNINLKCDVNAMICLWFDVNEMVVMTHYIEKSWSVNAFYVFKKLIHRELCCSTIHQRGSSNDV